MRAHWAAQTPGYSVAALAERLKLRNLLAEVRQVFRARAVLPAQRVLSKLPVRSEVGWREKTVFPALGTVRPAGQVTGLRVFLVPRV